MFNVSDLNIPMTKNDANQLGTLVLAYIGDCVYELLSRERVVAMGNKPVAALHKMTVSIVRASAQSEAVNIIMEFLTDDEIAIYKRGRNSEVGHIPKNGNVGEYHRATGLETLFGYLYLIGDMDRVKELYSIIAINTTVE